MAHMALKTYIPTLIFIVRQICIYTARYDAKIRANLPPSAIPAYDGLRAACDLFFATVTPAPEGD